MTYVLEKNREIGREHRQTQEIYSKPERGHPVLDRKKSARLKSRNIRVLSKLNMKLHTAFVSRMQTFNLKGGNLH